MSHIIRENLRCRRNAETATFPVSRGGSLAVCLIYPNRYYTAMSSLGFQTVYQLFNQQPDVYCERAFLPEKTELDRYDKSGETLLSLESGRPLTDFDLVAFSISFEPDFINIPLILKLARIPLLASERGGESPLLIAGGAACFLNPEPIADFFDIFALGEGEALIPKLCNLLLSGATDEWQKLLDAIGSLPGFYLPALPRSLPCKRISASLDTLPSCSALLTDETEFGNMFLVEVSRGCPRGCRFCAAGFVWQPFRWQPLEKLKEVCLHGLQYRKTIGLVGAAVSDHPQIVELCRFIIDNNGVPSLSSLRVDRIDPQLLELLFASGCKTISLAPEGGSQRMRDMIRKNLTEKQILEAVEMVADAGILNLRLYLIIGLPGETDEDLAELVSLASKVQAAVVEKARQHKRLGEITLSVNPFIPKPFTPLQWAGMASEHELKQKVSYLEKAVRKIPNLRLKVEELQGAVLQALLSRGGRQLVPLIQVMSGGVKLRKAAKQCSIDFTTEVTKTLPVDGQLPWDSIESADKNLLLAEYAKAMELIGVKP
ncbi:MAG: radical SAM protein [Trichlorobacter sp.]|nr:radical SAM protein [Trichlorobacter sp.]